jgi:uncharacterized UBP type Zn finger protein
MSSLSEKVAQLVEMGFERGRVEDALRKSQEDIEQAMTLLLGDDADDVAPPLIEAEPMMPIGEANEQPLAADITGIPMIPSNTYGSYANPSGNWR